MGQELSPLEENILSQEKDYMRLLWASESGATKFRILLEDGMNKGVVSVGRRPFIWLG